MKSKGYELPERSEVYFDLQIQIPGRRMRLTATVISRLHEVTLPILQEAMKSSASMYKSAKRIEDMISYVHDDAHRQTFKSKLDDIYNTYLQHLASYCGISAVEKGPLRGRIQVNITCECVPTLEELEKGLPSIIKRSLEPYERIMEECLEKLKLLEDVIELLVSFDKALAKIRPSINWVPPRPNTTPPEVQQGPSIEPVGPTHQMPKKENNNPNCYNSCCIEK